MRRLWGVGPATHERLTRLGVSTIGDLAAVVAGRPPRRRRARPRRPGCSSWPAGIDDRRVESERPVKSVSHEETFAFDLHGRDDLRTELARLADGVASRLRADGLAARTISLKVRDATFRTITRSRTLPRPVDSAAAIAETVATPCSTRQPPSGGVRLLGVAASKFAEPAEQLQLDGLGRRSRAACGATPAGRSTGCAADSAARRSVRRAPCPRPGCGSCVAASTSGGPTTPDDGGEDPSAAH